MPNNLGILVNGPIEWYSNLYHCFKKHGKTWIQSSKVFRSDFKEQLRNAIKEYGYVYAFGYEQKTSKVKYRFKITQIIFKNVRVGRPDETAPEFAEYDRSQGGCTNGKMEYPLWLKVLEMKQINPVDKQLFFNLSTNKPVDGVRGIPNWVVRIPSKLLDEVGSDEFESSDFENDYDDDEINQIDDDDFENNENEFDDDIQDTEYLQEQGISIGISIEKDLQNFLSLDISSIKQGLKLHEKGKEFKVASGRIDLLCLDKDNNFVVIELKAGKANSEVFAQIKGYIASLKDEKGADIKVRGIIIARYFDDNLIRVAKYDNEVTLLSYEVKFEFKEVKE